MDPGTSATLANSVLVALVPGVIKALGAAAGPIASGGEDLAKAVGQAVGQHTAALLKAISARFKGHPAAEEAMNDFVKTPQDVDAQAALRLQLKKLLETDESFRQELLALLEQAQKEEAGTRTTTVIASGKGAVATGGDTYGAVFTGNISDSDVKVEG